MESKRKTRKVHKVIKAQAESPKPPKENAEVLITRNGEQVEELMSSTVWKDIIQPLLDESIAGVSGRFTNGRYWHGTLTTNIRKNDAGFVEPIFLAGYQKALMDFHNNLHDFTVKKNEVLVKRKSELEEKNAPFVNPMTEDLYETED